MNEDYIEKSGNGFLKFLLITFLLGLAGIIIWTLMVHNENEINSEVSQIHPSLSEQEIRGVYIATVQNINFPSKSGLPEDALKSELNSILEVSEKTGFNTIYFQVRPTADALYESKIFPSSRNLVENEGDPLSFDPLSYLIEAAKPYGIRIVAWVNPYRITNSKAPSKEAALATLSEKNPAKMHPDWCVFHDGKLYFNPAISEVQALISEGVREIVEGYDVAGVLFDDYFYPYPVAGIEFEDQKEYLQSNSSLSLSDWRRENVNQMVKRVFYTIKESNPDLTFGISPFGIWQNSTSHPEGSQTRGLEAYSSLYCDAIAWIEGGYIDYIAPQIYWEKGFSAADFITLCDWWESKTKGTGVGLVISHAAYKAGDFSLGGEEISNQILYAKNEIESHGSIQYGFADIQKNTSGVRDQIQSVYADQSEPSLT